MRVGIFGDGSWACALADVVTRKGHDLYWWVHREELAQHITAHGRHPSVFPGHQFPRERLAQVSTDGREIITSSEVLLLALPSRYVSSALESWDIAGKPWISCTKGLLPESGERPSEYLQARGVQRFAVLSGPSYAEEVIQQRPTWVGLGSYSQELVHIAQEALGTTYFHLIPTRAVAALEWVGVLKNIYAIGLGAVGLLGDNIRAAMAAAMLKELQSVLQAWVPDETADLLSPAWAGDFLVTAFGRFSRNQRMGQYLAQGYAPRIALHRVGMVVEGYHAAQALREKVSAAFPFLNTIVSVLTERLSADALPRLLMEHLSS